MANPLMAAILRNTLQKEGKAAGIIEIAEESASAVNLRSEQEKLLTDNLLKGLLHSKHTDADRAIYSTNKRMVTLEELRGVKQEIQTSVQQTQNSPGKEKLVSLVSIGKLYNHRGK